MLYYPFIEFRSESWLKTASLYWDTLSTIVPEGIQPYTNQTASVFRDAGILEPIVVAPGVREVESAANDVVAYLDTPEGRRFLEPAAQSELTNIHVRKLSDQIRWTDISDRKMTQELLWTLRDLGIVKRIKGSWAEVSVPFGLYYMTVLATHLSARRGKSLATDAIEAESLADRIFRDDPPRLRGQIAEGVLASLVLRTVDVGPNTSAKKVVKFREKHYVEVARFRSAIRNLTKELTRDVDADALRSYVETLYSDEVVPAMADLRGRLQDNRISCGYNNLRLSTLMSASPTALGVALSGMPFGSFALAAGVGLSVVLSIGNYRIQRREVLRDSPYSYILAAEKAFGTTRNRN